MVQSPRPPQRRGGPVNNAAANNEVPDAGDIEGSEADQAETASKQAYLTDRDAWLQSRVAFHLPTVPF